MGVQQIGSANRQYHNTDTPRTSAASFVKTIVPSFKPFVPLLIAVVLGTAMTVGAIIAFKQTRSTAYGFQAPTHLEYLGAPSLREVLW